MIDRYDETQKQMSDVLKNLSELEPLDYGFEKDVKLSSKDNLFDKLQLVISVYHTAMQHFISLGDKSNAELAFDKLKLFFNVQKKEKMQYSTMSYITNTSNFFQAAVVFNELMDSKYSNEMRLHMAAVFNGELQHVIS
jgi:hypothetical protein